MGKGDKRSKRGKIIAGSYGNKRPKSKSKYAVKPAVTNEEQPAE